jgi:cytochrome c peroxidase
MIMEVEEFFETDVERLREPDLEEMFLAAFGSAEITTKRAAYAIAQFQRTLVSRSSRFDDYVAGNEAALTESEFRGMALFYSERGECFHCHATSLFTDNRFHNIGLDADVAGTGRGAVTGRARDDGLYKTPTLRNVEMTAPYMHDDRFATLEEVIDFYSEGVVYSDSIDSLIPNVTGGGLRLSAQERLDLVAFLRALTDPTFLSDPELARP